MNLEQFTKRIAEDLQTTLPHKYAHVKVISKNIEKIGGAYMGIELRPEGNISPLMKAEKYYGYYMSGMPYLMVVDHIARDAVDALDKTPTKFNIDINKLEENISIQVVQTEPNRKYLEIEDLSIFCKFNVEVSKGDEGSFVISDDWLDILHMSQEDLFHIAMEYAPVNRPGRVQNMADVLKEQMPEFYAGVPESPLMVVTNETAIHGASVLFYPGMLEKCADLLNGNFYVLPSSVHELLICRADETMRAKDLKAMVKAVNDTHLSPDELLSYNVYHYDWKEKVFELAEKYEARMKEKAKQSVMGNLEAKKNNLAMDGHLKRNQDIGCRRIQGGSLCL